MLSGLYGDLPQAKSAGPDSGDNTPVSAISPAASSWAAKLAPPARKPSNLSVPPTLLRAGRGRGQPSAGRTAGRIPRPSSAPSDRDGPIVVSAAPATAAAVPERRSGPASLFSFSGNVVEEYDPAHPNDYEEICRQREAKRKEVEIEAARQEALRRAELQLQQESDAGAQLAAQDDPAIPAARDVDLNVSGEEAFLRRGRANRFAGGSNGGPAGSVAAAAAAVLEQGLTPAQRMMQKMGWKEGQGLGKLGQGMATPLVATKTDKRSGIIANAAAIQRQMDAEGQPPPEKRLKGATFTGIPSRVIVLRNMVGPGEVDEDLEEETGNECTKYGTVTNVIIFEITEPDYPPEEAVRIFIEFERIEQATKALIDLQGRFFGGKEVRAAFFDETRFEQNDVAPKTGEFG
ncbi:hypothetical protein WJX74_004307 [Apatococcus lobatus]|uniref:Splicing factor 45 n=1 Tax=Apatococcus lobatus TaxID=904363 RepID=A0AAW1S208_9CHLO